jgi:nitroimidazol reductase NimA-like FMN-containing flavoprotein (pyridoxamine 5'-phosphate oxidase superfamily)
VIKEVAMGREECWDALLSRSVGRVAVSTPTGPYVVPVSYAVRDGHLFFRTSSYSILGAHSRAGYASFQIDEVDEATRSAWSVLVRGRVRVIEREDEQHWLGAALHLPDPWVVRMDARLFVLEISDLTGSRISPASA